jgi:hypothetical protein
MSESERPSDESASAPPADEKPIAPIARSVHNEREFLALCIALPEAGATALQQIDPDVLLTSSILRRAASHLIVRTRSPLTDLAHSDEELARVMADLVRLAGEQTNVSAVNLEHARLVLERARLDRAIARARGGGGGSVSDLAHERKHVLEAIHMVGARLEKAV